MCKIMQKISRMVWKTALRLRDWDPEGFSQVISGMTFDIPVVTDGPLPKAGSEFAQAFDLHTPYAFSLNPGESKTIDTGVQMQLPLGFGAALWSRSGLAAIHGIEKGAGLLDCDFGGTWKVVLRNHSDVVHSFEKDDRIVQAFCIPRYKYVFRKVNSITLDYDRGGGLGSTGR